MSFIQSFCRYEKKYLLSGAQYEQLSEAARDIIRPDMYGKHTICSIYLDTEDYIFIRESIEKPAYKEKLRIRSYGVPKSETDIFFEIKKKFDGIVYKRRILSQERLISEYAKTGVISEELDRTADRQILSEIDHIMKRDRPVPKVFIAYDRQAFEGISDPSLRITFDRNIRARTDRLRLTEGDSGALTRVLLTDEKGGTFTDEEYRLMEIKTPSAIPVELARILSELKIYPSSFSKYGEIYKQTILPQLSLSAQKGESVRC